MKEIVFIACVGLPLVLGSCYSFDTPSEYFVPAAKKISEENSMTSHSSASSGGIRRASVRFPARVAVARVESSRFGGKARLFDGRDLEKPEHAAIVQSLSGISGMVSLNNVSLQSDNLDYEILRREASEVGASLLAVYRFTTREKSVEQASLLNAAALGILPTVKQEVVSNVSLIIQDARTGYTYGVMEKQASEDFHSTGWGRYSSQENAKRRTRSKAFDELMQEMPHFWNRVARR